MLRHSRLVMMVLIAMFVVAVPTALAQTPTADQYQVVPPGGDTDPVDDGGAGPADDSDTAPTDDSGAAPADDSGNAPVDVTASNAGDGSGNLPFTGAQVSLIALIGLALLALGMVGLAATRKRGASTAS